VLAGVIALAGCGGSDNTKSASSVATTPAPTAVPTTATTPAPPQTTPTTTATTPSKPPETTPSDNPPPNSGGTEPARTELEFRGTKAGVKPTKASVAAFISVRVTLTSEDGSAHQLTINGQTAKVGGSRTSASFTLPGLPSGKSYNGVADGSVQVRIVSSSEPGP
jgi:hypothetical protein